MLLVQRSDVVTLQQESVGQQPGEVVVGDDLETFTRIQNQMSPILLERPPGHQQIIALPP